MRKVSVIILLLFLIGCSVKPTQPNISAIYRIPRLKDRLEPLYIESENILHKSFSLRGQALFHRLYNINSNLAVEAGRLPEFQDVVDEKHIKALQRFVDLIERANNDEKANLAKLLEEGMPEVRRYCTPLQAIFWILEKEENKNKNPLLYSLNEILNLAWCNQLFEYGEPERWNDFNIVTERLNSPFLVDYYARRDFTYIDLNRKTESHGPPPSYIFKHKKASSPYYTSFSVYCLKKAGYFAQPITVYFPGDYHRVCEVKDKDGKYYILDSSRFKFSRPSGIHLKETFLKMYPFIGIGYPKMPKNYK